MTTDVFSQGFDENGRTRKRLGSMQTYETGGISIMIRLLLDNHAFDDIATFVTFMKVISFQLDLTTFVFLVRISHYNLT